MLSILFFICTSNIYIVSEKRCATPAINLADGQTANITYPYVDNIYTYGTTAKYLCDIGYEFDDQSSDVTIACRQDNQWDNITQTCTSKLSNIKLIGIVNV